MYGLEPIEFMLANLAIIVFVVGVTALVVRGARMRWVAAVVATLVFVGTLWALWPGGFSVWLDVVVSALMGLVAFAGLRGYYRIFKESGRFPNLRW